jgi:hypothetical protein
MHHASRSQEWRPKNKYRVVRRGSGLPRPLEIAPPKPYPGCDSRCQDNTVNHQTQRQRREEPVEQSSQVQREPASLEPTIRHGADNLAKYLGASADNQAAIFRISRKFNLPSANPNLAYGVLKRKKFYSAVLRSGNTQAGMNSRFLSWL